MKEKDFEVEELNEERLRKMKYTKETNGVRDERRRKRKRTEKFDEH